MVTGVTGAGLKGGMEGLEKWHPEAELDPKLALGDSKVTVRWKRQDSEHTGFPRKALEEKRTVYVREAIILWAFLHRQEGSVKDQGWIFYRFSRDGGLDVAMGGGIQ